jgi:hypothetical protein
MATNDEKFVCSFRVSTGRQGKSGLGLEAQRAAVTAYLNGGNWKIVDEFTEVEERQELRPARAGQGAGGGQAAQGFAGGFQGRSAADLPQIEAATRRFLL